MNQIIRIPKHVAIVMDGNGRWAQRRMHPRIFGHIRGSKRVKEIVLEADRLGIKALTLYAFSTENWSRPDGEKQVLWKLLKKYLQKEREELKRENVRLRIIGEVERLSEDVKEILIPTIRELSTCTGLQLNFAVSYGGRREISVAAKRLAVEVKAGRISPEDINESLLEKFLWTAELNDLSDVDLVIRTSGEKRISNFLLWQSAYAEFVFTETLWPDFRAANLKAAIEEYSKRERRFGAVSV